MVFYKERLNRLVEHTTDIILKNGKKVSVEVSGSGKLATDLNDNTEYIKDSDGNWVAKKLTESYIQLSGPYNIPKLKDRIQKLCNNYGLQLTSNGKIDFNNSSLLKSEVNNILGELKNLGVSYKLIEGYKTKLKRLIKKSN